LIGLPNPSSYTDDITDSTNFPVENITWTEAITFCNAKSAQAGLPNAYNIATGELLDETATPTTDITKVKGYRLLTESEWEYAARNKGTRSSAEPSGASAGNITTVAWYADTATHESGTLLANELDLYDMSGNVWEWCHDLYGTYTASDKTDPIGQSVPTTNRVMRGGGYNTPGTAGFIIFLYTGTHDGDTQLDPTASGGHVGFRIARTDN
jgi:formylglycine-generating enzyme required for sulfatase activity